MVNGVVVGSSPFGVPVRIGRQSMDPYGIGEFMKWQNAQFRKFKLGCLAVLGLAVLVGAIAGALIYAIAG